MKFYVQNTTTLPVVCRQSSLCWTINLCLRLQSLRRITAACSPSPCACAFQASCPDQPRCNMLLWQKLYLAGVKINTAQRDEPTVCSNQHLHRHLQGWAIYYNVITAKRKVAPNVTLNLMQCRCIVLDCIVYRFKNT